MRRRTFDLLMSTAGLLLAVVLAVAGGLLIWAHSFVQTSVTSQLSQERITMPDNAGIAKLENKADQDALKPFIGQQMTNGDQAKAFADHYILAHMNAASGGKTYQEVSGQLQTMQPTDPNYAKTAALKNTLFQGDTLRGLLLNSYAFWTMGKIALIAAIAAFGAAGLMLILSILGFVHSGRITPEAQLFEHKGGEKELAHA